MSPLTMAPPAARLRTVYAASRDKRVCRHCGAPLTWYRTYPSGAWLAFEGEPVPVGHERPADTEERIDVLNRPTVHLCQGYRPVPRRRQGSRHHAA